MKLYLKTKNVLDERETQEMYRIEHRGMGACTALLCAAVVVQMLFGARALRRSRARRLSSPWSASGMIIAYARRGIWDADARLSTGGNAAYALLCALGVTAVTFGLHENAAKRCSLGGVYPVFCAVVAADGLRQKRQKQQSDELDDDRRSTT